MTNDLAKKIQIALQIQNVPWPTPEFERKIDRRLHPKMFADVIYMPTDRKNDALDRKKASKHHQGACRSTNK